MKTKSPEENPKNRADALRVLANGLRQAAPSEITVDRMSINLLTDIYRSNTNTLDGDQFEHDTLTHLFAILNDDSIDKSIAFNTVHFVAKCFDKSAEAIEKTRTPETDSVVREIAGSQRLYLEVINEEGGRAWVDGPPT